MNKPLYHLSASLLLLLTTSLAHADAFAFSYDDTATGGTIIDVSGLITATAQGGGAFLITGVTGTRNGEAITSFASGGPSPFIFHDTQIDNLLFVPPAPAFLSDTSTSGFAFGTSQGEFNPYFDPGTGDFFEYTLDSGNVPGTEINFSVNAVPEPAFYQLAGVMILSGVGLLRRRRRK
jgi:hypothetical protein